MIEVGTTIEATFLPDLPRDRRWRTLFPAQGRPVVIGSIPWLVGGCPWLMTDGVAMLLMSAGLLPLWAGYVCGIATGGRDYVRSCQTSAPVFELPVGEGTALVLREGYCAPTTWLPLGGGPSSGGVIVRWDDGPETGLMLDWLGDDECQLNSALVRAREMVGSDGLTWTPTDVRITVGSSPLVLFDSMRAGEDVGLHAAGLILPLSPGHYRVETAWMDNRQAASAIERLLLHRFIL